jgi:hypothetical protein
MSNRIERKLDLLQDCNDQHVPPKEFMSIFCKRCRNGGCVNAGWSGSTWSDRMATQVSRLLINPNFSDPSDSKFDAVRDLDFRHISEPVRGSDPWEVSTNQIHLVDPERQTNRSTEVENAVRALSETRSPPVVTPKATPPVRPNPRHYSVEDPPSASTTVSQREVNTSFPAEGLMLDGGSPANPQPTPSVDPWSAPTAPKTVKVAVGAKVKMGGK